MGGANTGLRLWDGDGGPQSICSRGATWPSPYPGHKPAGQAGDTLPFPSGEGEEDSGLGQAATLYCPIPFSANQNGFEVCLKMKPRYASVFMMLAMFLQSSKMRKKRHLDGPQILPFHAHRCSYMGGKQGQIQEPDFKLGGPTPLWQHLQL